VQSIGFAYTGRHKWAVPRSGKNTLAAAFVNAALRMMASRGRCGDDGDRLSAFQVKFGF
jgi:hypothetical protein